MPLPLLLFLLLFLLLLLLLLLWTGRFYHTSIMSDLVGKIKAIEEEMAKTQKNKATAYHLGLLKARLAKLKRELLEGGGKSGGGGGIEDSWAVNKGGADVRVALLGWPSVGKSTLLTSLTGTFSEAAAYEYTTLVPIPGNFFYMGTKVQVIDLPGIIKGAASGYGRGKQVLGLIKSCSMLMMVFDGTRSIAMQKKVLTREAESVGIRLNKSPPDITIKVKDRGGLAMTSTCTLTNIDFETVRGILAQEYRIPNADVCFRCDATVDELIDILEARTRVYMPCLYVINKIDQCTLEDLRLFEKMPNTIPISAVHKWNYDMLMEKVWEKANLVRIYTKPKGQLPDLDTPVVVRGGHQRAIDVAAKIHKQLAKDFKAAIVWGSSVKFSPQRVGRDHVLDDEDVVQIIRA